MSLSNVELDKMLRSNSLTRDAYVGAFPSDTTVKVPSFRPFAAIFNVDPAFAPGSHWTAVYVGSLNRPEYFDPLGKPPCENLRRWLEQFAHAPLVLKRPIQSPNSILCGYFCMFYIFHRCLGRDLRWIVRQFHQRFLGRNDKLVSQWALRRGMTVADDEAKVIL